MKLNHEKLNQAADELRQNVSNRFDVALLTVVETLADLDDGQICSYSCGNIGISITPDYIELVDIAAGTSIFVLEVK